MEGEERCWDCARQMSRNDSQRERDRNADTDRTSGREETQMQKDRNRWTGSESDTEWEVASMTKRENKKQKRRKRGER
jgi:hypothetical protein